MGIAFWQNSLGPILTYIYSKIYRPQTIMLTTENLIDQSYDTLFGTVKIFLPPMDSILLHPTRISFERFSMMLQHNNQTCLLDILLDTDFSLYGKTHFYVLGRYGNEENIVKAMLQCETFCPPETPPGMHYYLLSTALMNDSLSIETKKKLIDLSLFYDQRSFDAWHDHGDSLVLILARSNQPLELYEALYRIRKAYVKHIDLAIERALMMNLPDKQCIRSLTGELDCPALQVELAIIKKRSYAVFKALRKVSIPAELHLQYDGSRIDDHRIFFALLEYRTLEERVRLLNICTPPVQAKIIRRFMSKYKLSIREMAKVLNRPNTAPDLHNSIKCTVLQIIIETTIKKKRFIPFSLPNMYEKQYVSNLTIYLVRQFKLEDLLKLKKILSRYPSTQLGEDEDGFYLLSELVKVVLAELSDEDESC